MLDALLRRNLDLEFGERFPADEAAALADRFRELYVELGVPGTHLLPGAPESIDAVHAAGGRTLVVTAKYEPNARRCLDHVGLDGRRGVRLALRRRQGRDPRRRGRARVRGRHAQRRARRASVRGAAVVAVTTGPHPASELHAAGATVVLSSLAEFPAWLAARIPDCRTRPD